MNILGWSIKDQILTSCLAAVLQDKFIVIQFIC